MTNPAIDRSDLPFSTRVLLWASGLFQPGTRLAMRFARKLDEDINYQLALGKAKFKTRTFQRLGEFDTELDGIEGRIDRHFDMKTVQKIARYPGRNIFLDELDNGPDTTHIARLVDFSVSSEMLEDAAFYAGTKVAHRPRLTVGEIIESEARGWS